ncbi:hypothetical protein [Flavobacterium turcicum]|uniref:Uncharacterized protein n=1 Tax=Flavobacterium turcicum TaxID=2764718 RepID=A0ABR7JBU8_9FLAO|nr:hypothetical protein [Flavobacterium turcicum]MBC5861974.1 hypothetical protein [Flavobacterium turcicum]NHL00705.1 hypothetical protein [Flavobacterium turcicum]
MKKIVFSIAMIAILAACQEPSKEKTEKEAKGRYQMSVIQRTDSGEVCLFILDTETGEVTMRGDKSGAWTSQGSADDAQQ